MFKAASAAQKSTTCATERSPVVAVFPGTPFGSVPMPRLPIGLPSPLLMFGKTMAATGEARHAEELLEQNETKRLRTNYSTWLHMRVAATHGTRRPSHPLACLAAPAANAQRHRQAHL